MFLWRVEGKNFVSELIEAMQNKPGTFSCKYREIVADKLSLDLSYLTVGIDRNGTPVRLGLFQRIRLRRFLNYWLLNQSRVDLLHN